jgi:hypothetical protein
MVDFTAHAPTRKRGPIGAIEHIVRVEQNRHAAARGQRRSRQNAGSVDVQEIETTLGYETGQSSRLPDYIQRKANRIATALRTGTIGSAGNGHGAQKRNQGSAAGKRGV